MQNTAGTTLQPQSIKRSGDRLQIFWSGSELSVLNLADVRRACACAVCRELKVPLNSSMPFFPRATRLEKMDLVGNYAIALTWGDGHRSIMAFESLRAIEPQPALPFERGGEGGVAI